MAVSPAQTAAALRAALARESARVGERVIYARSRAVEAAAELGRRFGASQVWLHGSLASGTFHLRSDVDLAVRGISLDAVTNARAFLAERFADPSIDLLSLDALDLIEPPWASRIVTGGERLL